MREGKHSLKINMLGDLSVFYDEKPLILSKEDSSKEEYLFLLLLYYREKGIHRDELIEALYGEEDMDQTSDSFHAMVLELQKLLIEAGLPKDEYVIHQAGIYSWESDKISVWLDIEEFEKKAEQGLKEKDPLIQQRILDEVDALYRGEFLPDWTGVSWVEAENRRYQNLYFCCMRTLMELLQQQKNTGRLLRCCEKMTDLYPYEEWQLDRLDCLIGMKEYEQALQYYDEIADFYQEEFGLLPSEELKGRLQKIREYINYDIRNIHEIQERFTDVEELGGAIYCDLSEFTAIYRYMIRVTERVGMTAYLMLYTLTDKNHIPVEDPEILEEVRDAMYHAVKFSVRRSDLYTRYGKNQYLILLVETNQKGCEQVADRIYRNFQEENTHSQVEICHTISPIVEIKPDLIKKQFDANSLDWR